MSQVTYHDEYSEDAICKFREFVNHATRHNNLKLEITDIKSIQITFEVNEIFDLVVASEEEKFKGVVSGSRNDLLIENDDHEYKIACSRLVHQQSTDHDIYQECRNTIAGFEFGKFYQEKGERFLLHSNQTRVIHHFGCPDCSQSGMESCPSCRSTGILTCNACGGHGEISCLHCSGAGYRIEISRHRDGDGHYRDEEVVLGCTCNNGWNRCSSCSGSGEHECRSCDDGYVECNHCEATGWFSKVYEVSLWAGYTIRNGDTTYSDDAMVSSLSEDFLVTLDYKEPLENHVDLLYKETLEDRENLQIQVRRHFFAPASLFVANLEFEGQTRKSMIAFFGQQHYLLDAGCILDLVFKKDIQQLVELTRKLSSIFDRKLEQNLVSGIKILLSSPLLWVLLNSYVRNNRQSSIEVAGNLHKSLSTNETNIILKGLQRAFYFLSYGRLIKIISVLSGCGILIYCIVKPHVQAFTNATISSTLTFSMENLKDSTFPYFAISIFIFLIIFFDEKRFQKRLKENFSENYFLLKQMNCFTLSKILHSFFISFILIIFSVVLIN